MSTNRVVKLPLLYSGTPLTGILVAVAFGMLLSGCVIPYSFSELPKEHLTELRFPEDLRSSKDEVVVMVQSRRSKVLQGAGGLSNIEMPDVVNAPIFVPGETLSSLNQTLKLESESGIVLIFAWVGIGSKEELRRVCAVTQNGRNITVFPNDNEQSAPDETSISVNRRDAIVSVLREDTKTPFEKVDGPCGISGEVNWPKATRTRTIDFLDRIRAQPSDENMPLAQIISKGNTAAVAASLDVGGMLLISTSLHGQSSVESPMYFSTIDFNVLKEVLTASDATRILPMLPRYVSGRDAQEYLSLDLLLAVGSDGRVLWWSKEEKVWRGLNENPFDEEWKDGTTATLNRLQNEDRRQATAFLDRAHVPSRVRTLEGIKAELKLVTEGAETTESRALLLSVAFSAQDVVAKPFFLQTSDISPVATSIKLLSVGELMRLLPQLNPKEASVIDNLESSYLCLISEDGRIIELEQKSVTGWSKPSYSRATTAWRNEAISAVLRDGGYQGKFVCSLERTSDWPEELRGKVGSFIKKITARENGAAKH